MLRSRGILVGLVTRNTPQSVDAFFRLLGEEYRDLFSQVLTREFRFVKPDYRSVSSPGVEPSIPGASSQGFAHDAG